MERGGGTSSTWDLDRVREGWRGGGGGGNRC